MARSKTTHATTSSQPMAARQKEARHKHSMETPLTARSSADTITDDNSQINGGDQNGYTTPNSTVEGQDSNHVFDINTSSSQAIDNLSKESNKLLDAINEISMLGIDGHIPLPKIVTIGDQSAGKSSAIAAISGIRLPSKAGMCTRCPSHINLKRSRNGDTSWSCTISLEKKYFRDRNVWAEREEATLTELARISSPNDLEPMLERAQIASLNPDKEPTAVMSCERNDLPSRNTVDLSPNLVRLDITGPNCPNLTFYDLPGVFNQTAKREQSHLVDEIKRLVREYVEPETNIILLACAMENDVENSSASAYVEHATHRCIGLLTKADRLPEGYPLEYWDAILSGRHFHLDHGYYVTRQPSQLELDRGIDHAGARLLEDDFFRNHSPWCDEFKGFQSRFGIPRLQAKLSDLLVNNIRARHVLHLALGSLSSLPHLKEQISLRLREINARLASLPIPPGDKSFSIVSSLFGDLQSRLQKQMTGELPCNEFMRDWFNKVAPAFRDGLHDMRPTLVISTRKESEQKAQFQSQHSFSTSSPGQSSEPYVIDDSDNDTPITPSQSRKRQSSAQMSGSQSKKSRSTPIPFNNRPSKPPARTFIKRDPSPDLIDLYTNLPAIGPNNGSRFRLEEVRDIRQRMNTSAVVGVHDHRANEFLISEALKRWHEPLDKFIDTTTSKLQLLLRGICSELLGDWATTPLSKEMPLFVTNFIKGVADRHREIALHYLAAERLQPASLNREAVDQNQKQEIRVFTEARRNSRANLFLDQSEAKAGNFTTGEDREKKLKHVKDSDLEDDMYAGEVEAMGMARGYYNVALANFVDTIIKYMRLDIFDYTRKHLVKALEVHFRLHEEQGFQHCKTLLLEDAQREQERQSLEREKRKFEQAEAKLAALDSTPSIIEEDVV